MEDEILIVPMGSPDSFCRLCFSESNVEALLMPDIFPQPNQPLVDLIKRYVEIRLSVEQHMPCAICSTCRMMLEEFERFRERCLRCDYVLTGEDRITQKTQAEETFGELTVGSLLDEVWVGEHSVLPGGDDSVEVSKICGTCGAVFSSLRAMRSHAKKIHGEYPQSYECSQCPAKFKFLSGYQLHLKNHNNELHYRCDICQSSFNTEDVLSVHKAKLHGGTNAIKTFRCMYCPRMFVSSDHLRLHVNGIHDHSASVDDAAPTKKKKKSIATPAPPRPASVPPLVPLPGRETLVALSSGILTNVEQIPISVPIPTPPPPQVIVQTIATAQQQQVDESKKPFECSSCHNRFHFIGSLKRHINEAHTRQPTKQEMRQNGPKPRKVRAPVHTPKAIIEPVPIPPAIEMYQIAEIPEEVILPDQFTISDAMEMEYIPQLDAEPSVIPCLVYMERLDENLIPPIANYEIPLGKYFHVMRKKVQQDTTDETVDDEIIQNYTMHVANVHQMFYCQICFKPCVSRMALSRHKVRHNMVKATCTECGRVFPDKSSLDRHMPIHTNEYPHPCDECPLGFVRRGLLAKHKERYHGPNAEQLILYYCQYCPRAFSKPKVLKWHVTGIHGREEMEMASHQTSEETMLHGTEFMAFQATDETALQVNEEMSLQVQEEIALQGNEQIKMDSQDS